MQKIYDDLFSITKILGNLSKIRGKDKTGNIFNQIVTKLKQKKILDFLNQESSISIYEIIECLMKEVLLDFDTNFEIVNTRDENLSALGALTFLHKKYFTKINDTFLEKYLKEFSYPNTLNDDVNPIYNSSTFG